MRFDRSFAPAKLGRHAVLFALAAGVVWMAAGCEDRTAPPVIPAATTETDDFAPASSPLGAYLAARLAQDQGDSKAAAAYYMAALGSDSDNTQLAAGAFMLTLADGRFEDAVPLAEKLLTYDQEAPLPQLILGIEAARKGNYSDARDHFAAMHKRSITAVVSPMLTAWALAGSGLTSPALEALSPLGQFDGFKAVQAFHAGLILDLGGKTDAALEQYQVALQGPLNIRTIEAAGSAYQRKGDSAAAQALYDRYVAEHPETLLFDGTSLLATGKDAQLAVPNARDGMAEAMFDLTQVLRQTDQMQLALIFNRLALTLEPDFPLAQMTLADQLTTAGHIQEADAVLRAISPKSPVSAFARLRLAANLDDRGASDEALKELGVLEKERPNNVEVRITEGDIYRRRKDFHAAAQAYTQALALIKGHPAEAWSVYFSRGVSLERDHQWPQAEADLREALSLRPDQPDVMNYLAYSWIDRGLNLDEAKGMIERAVSLRPDDGAIVDSLGWALYRLGDYGQAVKMLERAVELKPEDPTINEHLGDAYYRAGRQNEARMQWHRATTLSPEPEQLPGLTEKVRTGVLPDAPALQ